MNATQLALDFNIQATASAPEDAPLTARGDGGTSSTSSPVLRIAYRLRSGEAVLVAPPPTGDGQGHNVGMWTPPSDAHWLFPLPHQKSVFQKRPS